MDLISAFFMRNIVYVYFFYGLAFFAMGLVVYLESGRASEFRFARALRPLAAFGFIHAGHEWFEMFQIFAAHESGYTASVGEELIRIVTLALSFLCLLVFGTRLLPEAERRPAASGRQVIGMGLVWLAGVALFYWRFQPALTDLLSAADVLARYGLGIPGALLAAWALLRERRDFHARGMSAYGQSLLWAALAFFVYGVLGQMFTRPSLVFPSQTINTALFLRTFGIPVQLLRGLAATAIAITLGGALRAFEAESRLRLARANKARIEAQAAALEAQGRRANEVEALNVQLRASARELSAMVELSRILTSTIDMTRLLHDAQYQIVHSFGRLCFSVVFLKRPDGGVEPAGEYRRPQTPALVMPAALQLSVAQAVATGLVAATGLDGQTHVLSADLINDQPYRILAAPLRAKGQIFGGLALVALRDEEPLGLEELKLLNAFAQQMATAIENARLYGVVQEREAQLEQMVRQLVNAQEGERQRIARELHDETGQKLTALAMGLAAVDTALAGDFAHAGRLVRDLREMADQTITELRNIMADLRPSQLDDLGLAPALRWYVERYAARYPALTVSFTADRLAGRLSPEHETVLFRAAQEALTNVVRHARATLVTVRLSQESGRVWLEVADNGVGFDVAAPAQQDGAGWGLAGMRERAALVGGTVTITSQPGQGTVVRIEAPVK
jgi:signal transduction histidine kinase